MTRCIINFFFWLYYNTVLQHTYTRTHPMEFEPPDFSPNTTTGEAPIG